MFHERDRRIAAVKLMHSTDPSYDNRTISNTLKMQIWIATNNRDMPRVTKTKFPATVMVFGVVSNEGHIMPPYIFEVSLKVNTKVYLDVLKSVVIPWCNLLSLAPLLLRPEPAGLLQQHDLPQHQSQPDHRHPPSIRRAPAGAYGKGMLPVPDRYQGGD